MRKAGFAVLSTLALLAIAAAAYLWVNALVSSIYGYSSPLKGTPAVTEDSGRPLTSQVVLLVVDGLRYDESLRMPYLNSLRKAGAHARMAFQLSSGSQTTWTTLLSGANPEVNGAPLFDPSYEGTRPMGVDNLFATVSRAGLTAGLAGFYWWQKLIPTQSLYTQYYVSAEDEAADQSVVDRTIRFINEFRPNFLLVHLSQVNAAGLRYGAASREYEQAVLRCDEHLRSLGSSLDPRRSVLVVASSHGQLDQGGYGADEPVLLDAPFVMTGENVLSGDYRTLGATDVAPTIAALLGTPTPSSAMGSARLDMLRTDSVQRAEALVALASQRVHIGSIYLYSIGRGALSETAEGDMLVARSSFQVRNYESAAELAALAIEQTGQEMAQARSSRIWNSRTRRAVPLAAAALAALWGAWHWRSRRMAWSILAALLAVALYHTLSLRQGDAYSFSRLPAGGLPTLLNPSAQHAAIALAVGGLIVVWRTWREQERSLFSVALHAYAYAAAQVCLVGLLVGACSFWNGSRFTWYLPSLKVAYIHFAALMQLMLVSALAIPLPIAVVALQRLALAVSDRFYATREA